MQTFISIKTLTEWLEPYRGTKAKESLCRLLDIHRSLLQRYLSGDQPIPLKVQIAIVAIFKDSSFTLNMREGHSYTLEDLKREWLMNPKKKPA